MSWDSNSGISGESGDGEKVAPALGLWGQGHSVKLCSRIKPLSIRADTWQDQGWATQDTGHNLRGM